MLRAKIRRCLQTPMDAGRSEILFPKSEISVTWSQVENSSAGSDVSALREARKVFIRLQLPSDSGRVVSLLLETSSSSRARSEPISSGRVVSSFPASNRRFSGIQLAISGPISLSWFPLRSITDRRDHEAHAAQGNTPSLFWLTVSSVSKIRLLRVSGNTVSLLESRWR